jgi:hypothetical protein
LPYRKKKTWWQPASQCCWNREHRLTCFHSASVTRKICNSAYEQTLFRRAKVLSPPPRKRVTKETNCT